MLFPIPTIAQLSDAEIVEAFTPPAIEEEVRQISILENRTPMIRNAYERIDANDDGETDSIVAVYSNGDSAVIRLIDVSTEPRSIGESPLQFPGFFPELILVDVDRQDSPEIIVSMAGLGGARTEDLLQWTGNGFRSLRPSEDSSFYGDLLDTDGDGVLELLVYGEHSEEDKACDVFRLGAERFELVDHYEFAASFAGDGVHDETFSVSETCGLYDLEIVNGFSRLAWDERIDLPRVDEAVVSYASACDACEDMRGSIANEGDFITLPSSIVREAIALNSRTILHVDIRSPENGGILVLVKRSSVSAPRPCLGAAAQLTQEIQGSEASHAQEPADLSSADRRLYSPVPGEERGEYFGPLLQELSIEVDRRSLARIEPLEDLAASSDWDGLETSAENVGAKLAREGARDSRLFGLVAAYRAIAAAETGKVRDAEWHWQAALNLLQGVSKKHLALARGRSSLLLKIELPAYRQPEDIQGRAPAPRLRDAVAPTFLLGPADRRRAPFAATLQVMIRGDGSTSSPRVLPPHAGAWGENGDRIYSGLEAVRQFRFEPIRVDGRAVEYPFSINLSFGPVGKKPAKARRLP